MWEKNFDFPNTTGSGQSMVITNNRIIFSLVLSKYPLNSIIKCLDTSGIEQWSLDFKNDMSIDINLVDSVLLCSSSSNIPYENNYNRIRKITLNGIILFDIPIQIAPYGLYFYPQINLYEYSKDSLFVAGRFFTRSDSFSRCNFLINKNNGNYSSLRYEDRTVRNHFFFDDETIKSHISNNQENKSKKIDSLMLRISTKDKIKEVFIDTVLNNGFCFFEKYSDSSLLLVSYLYREVSQGGLSVIEVNHRGEKISTTKLFRELDCSFRASIENGTAYIYCVFISRKNGFEIFERLIKFESKYKT